MAILVIFSTINNARAQNIEDDDLYEVSISLISIFFETGQMAPHLNFEIQSFVAEGVRFNPYPIPMGFCHLIENPENQAIQFWAFRVKMPKLDRPGSQDFQHLDKSRLRGDEIRDFWLTLITLL